MKKSDWLHDLRAVDEVVIEAGERLPEGNIQVIVSSGIFAPFIEMAFYDGLWYSAWDGETEIEAVTHWMPLPEPPKEET